MPKKKKDMAMEEQKKRTSKLNEYISLIQYFMTIYVCSIAVIFPLFVGPRGYENLTIVKNNLFHILTIIAVVAVIAVAIIMIAANLWDPLDAAKNFRKKWKEYLLFVDVAVLAYLVVTVISSVISEHQDVVYWGYEGRNDGLIITCFYVLIYFLVSRLYRFQKWHVFAFIGASVIVSFITIFNFFGIDWFGITDPMKSHFAKRMLSTIGNINFVSWYTAMLFCLTMGVFVMWKSKYVNWLILPLAVHSAALYYLEVDSGKVAVAASSIFLLIFAFRKRITLFRFFIALTVFLGFGCAGVSYFTTYYNNFSHTNDWKLYLLASFITFILAMIVRWVPLKMPIKEGKRSIVLASVVGAGILLVLTVLIILPKDTFTGFVGEFSRILHGEVDDSFGTNRMFIWKRSLKLFAEHPIIGTGQDTFGLRFMESFSGELVEAYGTMQNVDKAHNIYLQIMVCTGILGILGYLAFLCSVIICGIRCFHKNDFAAALTIAVISYSVQGCFLFSLPFVTPIFWVMAGMIVSIYRNKIFHKT